MAIEVFPDSPRLQGISPRISFSHDLSLTDTVPVEQYIRSSSASSSIDFDFCVFRESIEQEAPSADELFFDGKILPIEVKKRLVPPKRLPSLPPPVHPPMENHESVKVPEKKTPVPEQEEKQSSKSWFKRSTSLNCGSGYGRTLCPLPLLSRSNSTGSTGSGSGKRSSTSQKQSLLKPSVSTSSQKQSGYSSTKPPLKKNSNSYGSGAKFNPVLNVPPANMFGLGSIFSGGRDKTRKR